MYSWLILLFYLTLVRCKSIASIHRDDNNTISFRCINYSNMLYGASYFMDIISDNGFKYSNSTILFSNNNNCVSISVHILESISLPDKFYFTCITGGGTSKLIVNILKDSYIERIDNIKKHSKSRTVSTSIIHVSQK